MFTLLLQMSPSGVLLLPGDDDVVIPLGHSPLEGNLNWLASSSQPVSTEGMHGAW